MSEHLLVGRTARCTARYGDRVSQGEVRLETDELVFRGDFRLSIPFKEMWSVEALDGWVEIAFGGKRAGFRLGPKAADWVERILRPPGLLDKLGVGAGMRVSVLGLGEEGFEEELKERGAEVSRRLRRGSDIVFFLARDRGELGKLPRLQEAIARDGAVWVIWPKGGKGQAIREGDVIAAGPGAGLVDVKVVRFSDSLSALKLVVPVAKR